MRLIVGLGNPGEKYDKTRHNLGFIVLDQMLSDIEPLDKTFWEEDKNLKAYIKKVKRNNSTLLLAKPTTFMNNSGVAVSKILSYYKIKPEDMIVVQDDLDLPFGKIRIRFGGGSGGHHGVESILNAINTDKFLRVRLGIGNPRKVDNENVKDRDYKHVDEHVLGRVSSAEQGKIKSMVKQAIKDIEIILDHGIDLYMSRYNSR